MIATSRSRAEQIARIQELEKKLAEKSEQVLGKRAHLAVAVEVEFTGIGKGDDASSFPELLKGTGTKLTIPVFENSRYVQRVDAAEPVFPGATQLTPDGHYARQLELIIGHEKSNGKPVTMLELARVLGTLPKILTSEAPDYGLARVEVKSVSFAGEKDQANACHFNINLVAEDGTNLYEAAGGRASPLSLCCAQELVDFEKNGGLALYVPTEGAYQRLLRTSGTEPSGRGIKPRREFYNNPTMMLRGKSYTASRVDDTREHKIHDPGGIRIEHRVPSPETITIAPDEFPLLLIESYLLQHIHALNRLALMSDEQKKALTPESLWEQPLEKFPRHYTQALQEFEKSEYLKTHYPDLQKAALEIMRSSKKRTAPAR